MDKSIDNGKKEIYLICNAHLDPVWQWDWEEGAAAAVATFRSAADLLDKYDFIFCHNEALLYEWVEEYEPELFKRIQKFVRDGKWHIMGGWYLQPDCNLPCGESLVRQALTGRAYFSEKFGAQYLPVTSVNFDPFGHSHGLPQILKKCGYQNYLFMRPLPSDRQGVPCGDFIWRGVDGSEVKAAYSGFYASAMGHLREKLEVEYQTLEKGTDPRIHNGGTMLLSCWGVGNHGGGPSAKDLEYITQEIQNGTRATVVHSTPDSFFSRMTPTEVYEKSLNICMPGCYTSIIRIKQEHRRLENRLYCVEKMLSAAALNGLTEYPEAELREAEQALLFCEFHDILPGSCIRKGEESTLKRLAHGQYITDKLRARAFFALQSGLPKAKDGEYPFLVYNHHPYTVKTAADCGFMLLDQEWDEQSWTGVEIYDGDKKLPSQMVRAASSINLDWAKYVMFDCELPPFTMRMFSGRSVATKKNIVEALPAEYVYEDKFKRVEFNTKTGFIDGIVVGGKRFVKRGAFTPVVYADNADAWAMGDEQRAQLGRREKPFKLMTAKECAEFLASDLPDVPPLRIVEDGEVCRIIEGFYKYGSSSIVMRYKLYKNLLNFDVELRVLWNESDKLLKLHIPTAIKGEYVGQIAYGREIFPQNGRECVAQQWTSYGNENAMLAVINDGVYGSSCVSGDIGITLLRGAVYAAHPINDRPIIPSDRFCDRMDQGERVYRFRVNVGKTSEISPELDRMAQLFNEPPFAINSFPSGNGKTPKPALRLSDHSVTLTAFKRKRNGDGYVIRLFNNTDLQCKTVLTATFSLTDLSETSISLSFTKYEVKTLIYDGKNLYESAEMLI